MDSGVTILIADDHALLRLTLADRLGRESDLTVVGVAGNASEAISRVVELHPDVVLMDMEMPGLSPLDAARRIQSLEPKTRVIFLAARVHDLDIEQALAVNASGCLTKHDPPETVVVAIREVASGRVYFSEDVRSRIAIPGREATSPHGTSSRVSKLTPRELEILRYVASGLTQKEIATTAHISAKTVDNHTTNLMNKLGIHDRVKLTRFAIREGIVEP